MPRDDVGARRQDHAGRRGHDEAASARRVRVGVVAFAALSVVAVWATIAWSILDRSAATRAQADEDARRLTSGVAALMERTFGSIRIVLGTVAERITYDADGIPVIDDAVRRQLGASAFIAPMLNGVGIVAPGGGVLATVGAPGVRVHGLDGSPLVDVGDRDYFVGARDAPPGTVVVGAPVRARLSDEFVVPVALRLTNSDGRFGGVVNAGLRMDAVTGIFADLRIGGGGVTLFRDDGVLLAVAPDGFLEPGRDYRDARLFRAFAQSPAGGIYEGIDPRTRAPTVAAFRPVEGWPMVVAIGVPRGAAEDAMVRTAAVQAAGGLLVGLAVIVAACFAVRASQRLERSARALRSAVERADEASRAKSDFLARMSHELRTPLNAVIGFSDLIQTRLHGPQALDRYVDYAADIGRAGRHLLRIVDDVLDLARVENRQVDMDPAPLPLADALAECASMVRPRAEEAGLSLVVAPTTGDVVAFADARAVRQVLLNLLTNSIKFTPAGGSILLEAADWPDCVVVRVVDDGQGIPEDRLPHVFEPFRRGRSDVSDGVDGAGLGLGLSIARTLAEMNGGTLTLDSAVGRGTTATLTLPRAQP
jgi:two-component system cell cycle sensor histidine kinase PleC